MQHRRGGIEAAGEPLFLISSGSNSPQLRGSSFSAELNQKTKMPYTHLKQRLNAGERILLDGGIGTELERRGVPMNPDAWCGPTSVEHRATLEQVHLDYITAGVEIITTNTFDSSRLMLEPAGLGDRVAELNQAAVEAALSAKARSGNSTNQSNPHFSRSSASTARTIQRLAP